MTVERWGSSDQDGGHPDYLYERRKTFPRAPIARARSLLRLAVLALYGAVCRRAGRSDSRICQTLRNLIASTGLGLAQTQRARADHSGTRNCQTSMELGVVRLG